jgi:hypothetical protein
METPTPTPPAGASQPNSYQTIDEKLKFAKIAIDNALNVPDLAAPLAARGYDTDALQSAATLYQKAESLHLSQKSKYGDKFEATDDFDELRAEVDDSYSDHLALARIVLKNNRGDLEKLQANGKRKASISGWIGQTKAFYANALDSASIKAALATKGVSEGELSDTQGKVVALEKKEAIKYDKRGDAQNATSDRDGVIDELLEWHRDFVDTARIALKKTPQLLEKLGITVKK